MERAMETVNSWAEYLEKLSYYSNEDVMRDRKTAYFSRHWRDKYVLLLPHIDEIKGLTDETT
jgi:hypothetical protein